MREIEHYISKTVGKTIFDYKMIEENDRVLVAVSGGKDSMTLLYDLINRQKRIPIKYEIFAVHINVDFMKSNVSIIEDILKEWKVNYRVIEVGVAKRLKSGKKMNCYWCSTQRRVELLNIAQKEGYNKIALGHHLDDIIETYFMNVCFKGEAATMLPIMRYKKFPCSIIRPLALLTEEQILDFAKDKNIVDLTCKCPYSDNSKRLDIKKLIDSLTKNNRAIKRNIFNAMHNFNEEYLI